MDHITSLAPVNRGKREELVALRKIERRRHGGVVVSVRSGELRMANTTVVMKGPQEPSTTAYIPVADLAVADGLHGDYDVYWRPVDSGGVPTGSEIRIRGQSVLTDQGASQLAFEGADGYGRLTSGGRGGTVWVVTNTNDSGSGSLREAAEASGTRAIVFAVSGTITLLTDLRIQNPNCSIYGQTSPGDGIQVAGNDVRVEANNVVLQYLRCRSGSGALSPDTARAISIQGSSGARTSVIVNHCEAMFAIDQCLNLSGDEHADITISDSIIAWGLNNAGHSDGDHSKGFLVQAASAPGPTSYSLHRNIFANCVDRLPGLIKSGVQGWYNNYIFNKDGSSGSAWLVWVPSEGTVQANVVGNMFDPGPENSPTVQIKGNNSTFSSNEAYLSNNEEYVSGGANSSASTNFASGWTEVGSAISAVPTPSSVMTPDEARTYVLENAGAVVPFVDALTQRVRDDINGVTTGIIIDDESEVGGLPTLTGSHPSGYDDNGDGVSDAWANRAGMDGGNLATTIHKNGYSYLENFVADLARDYEQIGSLAYLKLIGALPSGTTDVEVFFESVGDPFNPASSKSVVPLSQLRYD